MSLGTEGPSSLEPASRRLPAAGAQGLASAQQVAQEASERLGICLSKTSRPTALQLGATASRAWGAGGGEGAGPGKAPPPPWRPEVLVLLDQTSFPAKMETYPGSLIK